jgi:hypothetical protein
MSAGRSSALDATSSRATFRTTPDNQRHSAASRGRWLQLRSHGATDHTVGAITLRHHCALAGTGGDRRTKRAPLETHGQLATSEKVRS